MCHLADIKQILDNADNILKSPPTGLSRSSELLT